MKSISGICSFSKRLYGVSYCNKLRKMNTKSKIVFTNDNCLISICDGEYAYREGVGLFFVGNINNIDEIKERYRLKDTKKAELLISLYLLKESKLYGCIDGSFTIVIYDEIKKALYLGGDILGKRDLYIAESSDCLYFSSSLKGLTQSGAVIPIINESGVLRLIASKALYTGESIEGVKKLYSNECMLYSAYGTESILIKKEFKDRPIFTYVTNVNPEKGNEYLYSICDSFGCMGNSLSADIIKASVKNNAFCDSLAKACLNNLRLIDFDRRLSISLPLVNKLTDTKLIQSYIFSLLCDLEYFDYENEKDIEEKELMYINFKCIISPLLSDITKMCDIFDIENKSRLILAVASDFLKGKGELFKKLIQSREKNTSLTQDIKERGLCLYQNPQSEVFKIISRADFLDARDEDIIYILRLNHFLEVIKPHLKF